MDLGSRRPQGTSITSNSNATTDITGSLADVCYVNTIKVVVAVVATFTVTDLLAEAIAQSRSAC
jgi:hypothetical protein